MSRRVAATQYPSVASRSCRVAATQYPSVASLSRRVAATQYPSLAGQRHRGRRALAGVALLLFAGCPRPQTAAVAPPSARSDGPAARLAGSGLRHTERLARFRWLADEAGAVQACGRGVVPRAHTTGATAGGAAPTGAAQRPPAERPVGCRTVRRVTVGDGREPVGRRTAPRITVDRAPDAQPAGEPDRTPPEFAPAPCRVAFEDAPGDLGAPAARATLVGPVSRLLLDAWKPPAEIDGDYFAIETSFSPDGKWLAIAHTAVGVGEGDLLVEIVSLETRPSPPCR